MFLNTSFQPFPESVPELLSLSYYIAVSDLSIGPCLLSVNILITHNILIRKLTISFHCIWQSTSPNVPSSLLSSQEKLWIHFPATPTHPFSFSFRLTSVSAWLSDEIIIFNPHPSSLKHPTLLVNNSFLKFSVQWQNGIIFWSLWITSGLNSWYISSGAKSRHRQT